jgi:hypothetical protein
MSVARQIRVGLKIFKRALQIVAYAISYKQIGTVLVCEQAFALERCIDSYEYQPGQDAFGNEA